MILLALKVHNSWIKAIFPVYAGPSCGRQHTTFSNPCCLNGQVVYFAAEHATSARFLPKFSEMSVFTQLTCEGLHFTGSLERYVCLDCIRGCHCE